MLKADMLKHWEGLREGQPIRPGVIAYKHRGSTFDKDSIRITGSTRFIDAVLSRVKDMLAWEGIETRLQVSYQQSNDKQGQLIPDAYNCYIQVHQRGGEGAMLQAFMAGDLGKVRDIHEDNLALAYGSGGE